MIYDTLKHADIYASLHPQFAAAFEFLRRFDPATPEGQIDLDGDKMFASIQRYATRPAAKNRYEAHQNYLDVQTIFAGREVIYAAPLDRLEVVDAYNADNDAAFWGGPDCQFVDLVPGDFAIFLLQDGHKPCCHADGLSDVVKVVMKIKITG